MAAGLLVIPGPPEREKLNPAEVEEGAALLMDDGSLSAWVEERYDRGKGSTT